MITFLIVLIFNIIWVYQHNWNVKETYNDMLFNKHNDHNFWIIILIWGYELFGLFSLYKTIVS